MANHLSVDSLIEVFVEFFDVSIPDRHVFFLSMDDFSRWLSEFSDRGEIMKIEVCYTDCELYCYED